jgi:ABC-type transport system substrate-binding protein
MDTAINAGHSTTNMAQRKKAYDQVQKILMTDLPTWFMPIVGFSPNHFLVGNKAVQNWGGGQWTGPLTAQIWLKEKK